MDSCSGQQCHHCELEQGGGGARGRGGKVDNYTINPIA